MPFWVWDDLSAQIGGLASAWTITVSLPGGTVAFVSSDPNKQIF
jgi:hypothetical protein